MKGRIITTLFKAKEVRPVVEKCVTIARRSSVASARPTNSPRMPTAAFREMAGLAQQPAVAALESGHRPGGRRPASRATSCWVISKPCRSYSTSWLRGSKAATAAIRGSSIWRLRVWAMPLRGRSLICRRPRPLAQEGWKPTIEPEAPGRDSGHQPATDAEPAVASGEEATA